MKDQLAVGFIRGPHGITGECKVESASGAYDHIVSLKDVTLRHGEETERRRVESADWGGTCVFMKLAGIDSPEAVRKYNGWEVVVPRECAYPLKKGEWYIDDLKDCSLVYEDKNGSAASAAPVETIGKITDVLEGGAAQLLEVRISEACSVLADDVKRTVSGKPKTVYVPFTEEHIGDLPCFSSLREYVKQVYCKFIPPSKKQRMPYLS